ncbi:MAG TPA: SBBP repeat-containing protein [Verrucomicrobiae bacterium]|jgi:hypothetical protein
MRISRLLIALMATWSPLVSAQIQQAWVAKYNNSITNGNHQALKMSLDSAGNIYMLGVSANANTNTGYVVVKYAPNGNQLWAARYDSTNFPTAAPTGFALDGNSNIVVTGSAVTVKYAANGNQLWTAPYNAQSVAVDAAQNIYITGVLSNFTTVKLDPAGSNIWTVTKSSSQGQSISQVIAVDSSTNVYVAGGENLLVAPYGYALLGVLKYDRNGTRLWEDDLIGGGTPAYAQAVGIIIDKSENVYLECNFTIGAISGAYAMTKIYPDGSADWQAYDPTDDSASLASSFGIDSLGNIVVTGGNDYNYPNNMYGTYKINTNGNYVWSNTYPTVVTGNSIATSIAVDPANSVYVTGFSPSLGTNRDSDIVTIKYDSPGNQVWLQRYDGPAHENDAGNAIAVDNSGNVYVAGYETETNGFTSMILIKYSPVTLQQQPNGNFILHASGSPGETFDIQASTNLQTWQDLGSITADTNGIALFEDTNAPLFPNRFYYAAPK